MRNENCHAGRICGSVDNKPGPGGECAIKIVIVQVGSGRRTTGQACTSSCDVAVNVVRERGRLVLRNMWLVELMSL